jgi:hypothetical protein
MKFLDKIAFNRLVAIITSFILSIIKLFAPKTTIDIVEPTVKRKTIIDKLKDLRKKRKSDA